MRYIIILYLILTWKYADSHRRIFYNAADVYNYAAPKQGIKRLRTPWSNHGRFLLLVKNDGSKNKNSKKGLWGCQNAKSKLLLFYMRNTYGIIVTIAQVIIYKTYSSKPFYYFSESSESRTL